jgi:glycosyltransferase involved in cell wall biosynthesis
MSTVVMTLALPEATGAPKMAYLFAQALVGGGHRVVLAHGPDPAADGDGAGESILGPMREIGVRTVPVDGLAFPLTAAAPRRVAEIAVEHAASSVIGFQQRDRAVALKAAHRAGIPGVISAQNRHTFRGTWPVRQLKRRVYMRAVRALAELVICPSEAVRCELIESFGVRPERTVVVPNGIDVERFPNFSDDEKARVRAEFDVGDDELMLLSIGRIDTQKGYDVLLRAVEQMRPPAGPFKLIIVGGISRGPTRKQMERYEKNLRAFVAEKAMQHEVRFAGWRDDCPLLLRAADIYVHSARWEGWPLAVVEAMGAERPIVTTDCAGRPLGFVDGAHGWVVPTGDSGALSRALQDVIAAAPARRAAMGRASRAIALEHYDIRRIGERFVRLIESIHEGRKSAGAADLTPDAETSRGGNCKLQTRNCKLAQGR